MMWIESVTSSLRFVTFRKGKRTFRVHKIDMPPSRVRRQLIVACCISLLVATSVAPQSAPPPLLDQINRQDRFLVVDMLRYPGKPDVSALGMIPGTGTDVFWKKGESTDTLDEAVVRAEMLKWKDYSGVFWVGLEHWTICTWPNSVILAPDSVIRESIAKITRVVDLVHEVAPHLTFGLYGPLPLPGYWDIVAGDTSRYRVWKTCNDNLRGLASKVDIIFPSLYTYYEDEAGWDKYALAELDAARSFGKPVYAFLWPEYSETNSKLAGKNVPSRVWRHELEFVKAHGANGMVLWNGYNRPWDEEAPWWEETLSFLKSLKSEQPTR
jgi:hypothetical protein